MPTSFDHAKLHKALMKAEELMDRALLPVLVLDETADAVFYGKDLYGDKITIGIFKENDIPFLHTVFDMYAKNIKEIDDGYQLEVEGVPIKIKVFQNRYDFLQPSRLNYKHYQFWSYGLPNPFKEYWEKRGEIE